MIVRVIVDSCITAMVYEYQIPSKRMPKKIRQSKFNTWESWNTTMYLLFGGEK